MALSVCYGQFKITDSLHTASLVSDGRARSVCTTRYSGVIIVLLHYSKISTSLTTKDRDSQENFHFTKVQRALRSRRPAIVIHTRRSGVIGKAVIIVIDLSAPLLKDLDNVVEGAKPIWIGSTSRVGLVNGDDSVVAKGIVSFNATQYGRKH
jgi:hypothetical protein